VGNWRISTPESRLAARQVASGILWSATCGSTKSYHQVRTMVARYSVCHSPSNLYTSHIRRVCNVGIPHSHAFSTGDYAMTAAEREWLQEEANSVLCDALDGPPAPRFDWRLRATSRQPIPAREPDSRGSHRHYIKRMKPPHTDALNGEPFFDEIQVYQARYIKPAFNRLSSFQ